MLCRCASPGGEPSVCIARACSHASRVPVSAGGPVPSPGQAAAAAPQQCCQAPTCHTNDACGRREQAPQQTGGRSSCSAAQASARRMSAAQQCSSMQAQAASLCPCLLSVLCRRSESESFCLIGVLFARKLGQRSSLVSCVPLLGLLRSSEGSFGHRSTLPCNAADFPSVHAL